MTTKPDLGIKNPYQLNEAQFAAAIDLLEAAARRGRPVLVRRTPTRSPRTRRGDVVIGTSWQLQANLLQGEDQPIEAIVPDEGSTGWSDTWMIHSKAKNPNCMYLWMNHMASAEANGQATVYFGEAPTSQAACDVRRDHLARSLRADARDRRGVLRQDLVLVHPAGRLRRRRRGHAPARTRTPGSMPGPSSAAPEPRDAT